MEPAFHNALKNLKEGIPRLAQLLKFGDGSDIASWINIVEAKLIPSIFLRFSNCCGYLRRRFLGKVDPV